MRRIFKWGLLGIIVAGNYLLHYNKFTYEQFSYHLSQLAVVQERTTGIITSIKQSRHFFSTELEIFDELEISDGY